MYYSNVWMLYILIVLQLGINLIYDTTGKSYLS